MLSCRLACGRFPTPSIVNSKSSNLSSHLYSPIWRQIRFIADHHPTVAPIPGVQWQSTNELRTAFLDYFKSQGHANLPSSSVIPHNDPSLLFTSAGMVPFKNIFLGVEPPVHGNTVTTSQRCIRAGGKHNDLDNVGHTARHHTYFEMLGNFSFGSYFKEGAMRFAWEFLTKVVKLPEDRLRISVFETDDESAAMWARITGWTDGEATGRIFRMGEADNFWQMGETGPCGPCSEIYWDQLEDIDGERYLEIWNLVFMQYDKQTDGSLVDLKQPCVDTGMGLERLASVVQGVKNNYDTDAMLRIVNAVAQSVPTQAEQKTKTPEETLSALRVVADHLRSIISLFNDGVTPSSSGRGYVLRRILRRACRYGTLLGHSEPFLHTLVPVTIETSLKHANSEVGDRVRDISEMVRAEEVMFINSLLRGTKVIHDYIAKQTTPSSVFPPELAFQLYDSFGFPVDLTELCVREMGLSVDTEAVGQLMDQRRQQSRLTWVGSGDDNSLARVGAEWNAEGVQSSFVGYDTLSTHTHVNAVHFPEDDSRRAYVSVSESPFYATGGGQMGDIGSLSVCSSGVDTHFPVFNTVKPYEGGCLLMVGVPDDLPLVRAQQLLSVGHTVTASVDRVSRRRSEAHHTATHLLHAALQRQLGSTVKQAGSLVSADTLRFDFTFPRPLTLQEIHDLEQLVNSVAVADNPVSHSTMTLEQARAKGSMALFGEKYREDAVRVVEVSSDSATGNFSTELCGGTHVKATLSCYPFKIIAETGVSAGTRRIEALAGVAASSHLLAQSTAMANMTSMLKIHPLSSVTDFSANLDKMMARLDTANKEVKDLKQAQHKMLLEMAAGQSSSSSSSKWKCLPGWSVAEVDVNACAGCDSASKPHILVYGVPLAASSNYASFRKLTEDFAMQQYSQAREGGVSSCLVQVFIGENGKALCYKTVDNVDFSGKKKKTDTTIDIIDAIKVWKCIEQRLTGSKGGGSDVLAQGSFAVGEWTAANISEKVVEILQQESKSMF